MQKQKKIKKFPFITLSILGSFALVLAIILYSNKQGVEDDPRILEKSNKTVVTTNNDRSLSTTLNLPTDPADPNTIALMKIMEKSAVDDGFRTDDFQYVTGVISKVTDETSKTISREIRWRAKNADCEMVVALDPEKNTALATTIRCN